jgi:hypothetical protein
MEGAAKLVGGWTITFGKKPFILLILKQTMRRGRFLTLG